MAIGTIKIDKLFEKDNIGYYKVSTDDYESNDFFMEINKKNRLISFYLMEDFSKPIKVIDPHKEEPIGSIPGVHFRAYIGAFIKALKILNLNNFPDRLSYSA